MAKILTAYFSAEGTTRQVAERLASAVNADLFEIVPETPYSRADLNYTNPFARCNREKFTNRDVPLRGTAENFDTYDVVLIGFPIWYAGAPNAVNSFAKAYDWTGKKIALFATSGGSPIGKTKEKFLPYLNGKGTLLDAKLFRPSASEEELKRWAEEL